MTDPVYAKIGTALRVRRNEVGMTQSALAAHLSLSRTSVTNIERGRQPMLVHQLLIAARVLKLDPSALLADASVREQETDSLVSEEFDMLMAKLKPIRTPRS